MQQILLFLRNFSQLRALSEPPCLLISETPATNTVFYGKNIKRFPPKEVQILHKLLESRNRDYLSFFRLSGVPRDANS